MPANCVVAQPAFKFENVPELELELDLEFKDETVDKTCEHKRGDTKH
ncbi:hypothetical protein [Paraglaciecola sp. T6c]|nr:hypothetical protein [Paraglaciecola sp. T6c]